jgi:hypothetical protein
MSNESFCIGSQSMLQEYYRFILFKSSTFGSKSEDFEYISIRGGCDVTLVIIFFLILDEEFEHLIFRMH